MLTRFLFCFLLLSVRAWATYDLPADRKPPIGNWQNAGIPGGIPTLSVGVTVTNAPYRADPTGVTNCDAAIAAADLACPANQCLYLPPGTFRTTNVLNLKHAIRGAGPALTRIKSSAPYGSPSGNGAIIWFEGAGGSSANMFATNGLRGDTSIKLTSVSGLSLGQWVTVKENQDPTLCIGTMETPPPSCLQNQQCVITAISGTNVTLDRALYWDFKTSLSALLSARTMLTNVGVENIYLEQTSTNSPARELIDFSFCAYAWATNVVGTNSGEDGIALAVSTRCNIQHNTCLAPQKLQQSRYGYHAYIFSDENLFENNIADGYSTAFLLQGGAMGNVVSYNYHHRGFNDTETHTQDLKSGGVCHGDFANFNLFEGNNFARILSDNFWGANTRNIWFRNWSRREHLNEFNEEVVNELIAVRIDATNYYNSFLGNILCSPRDIGDPIGSGTHMVWQIGCDNDNTTAQNCAITDTNTAFTLIAHGNFNFVTNATAWDPGIADHVLTNSYYLTSKPAWFGPLAWPPYGPDVAVTVSTNITAAHLLPAEVRYFTGLDPGQVVTNIIFSGTLKLSGAVRTP